MTERPRIITAFSDERPFAAASNALQYAHPKPRRSLFWTLLLGWPR